jgi:phenylacetate-CoA ligase
MTITPLHGWIAGRTGRSEDTFTSDSLEKYQLAQLQTVLSYASNQSPFYRKTIGNLASSVTMLRDLSHLPFTTPEDLRQDPGQFVCVSQNEVARIITLPTSGTSGLPKRIYFSAEDQELTVDFFQVGMSTLARPGDRVLILLPSPKPGTVGQLLTVGLERLGCNPILYGLVDDEEHVLHLIKEQSVNVLVGVPVQLLRLARVDENQCIVGKGKIHSILTSTDVLSPVIRKTLEQDWDCEVFDHYGMTETGLGGGVECGFHTGFHMRAADLLYEIIDPMTGDRVPDGETGEIVFTTLTRKAMPLIRYRTGDIGRILPETCACGSFIQRIGDIRYRIGTGFEFPGEELYHSDFDQALFLVDGLMDFSASIDKQADPWRLKIETWMLQGWDSSTREKLVNAIEQIPSIQQSILAGYLMVELSEMVRPISERTGYLSKRRIQIRGDKA